MKKIITFATIVMFIAILSIWGCGKNTTEITGTPETDEEAIQLLLNENGSYFETDNQYGEEDTTGVRTEGKDEINTYFWYREKTNAPDANINIEINGDSAFVEIQRYYEGILHLFALENDTITTYTKNFSDRSLRYAVFKRIFDPDNDSLHRRGWRLVEISGAETGSPNHSVVIDSVRLNCDSYPDTVLVAPLTVFSVENFIKLLPEEPCSLTVYTNCGDLEPDYVFLHSWQRNRPHYRRKFNYEGNGIFSGIWFAPTIPTANGRVHHAAFDMLSRETLKDDTLSYDSEAWIFPYRVVAQ